MPARRLLIFSYYFPPDPSVGGARWAAMSEWLRGAGHEVTVITSRANGCSEDDEPWVLRTFDVGAVGSARRLLRRSSAPPAQAPGHVVHKPPPRWFTDVWVPDECLLTWVPGALARARGAVREREIECVITSGPPHSTHLLAPLLGRPRPAWVADLRDGWRFEALRPPWPTRAQDRLDATLERRALRAADAVIGVTSPIAEDARARLGVLAAHIPNGWSPELDGQPSGLARTWRDPRRNGVARPWRGDSQPSGVARPWRGDSQPNGVARPWRGDSQPNGVARPQLDHDRVNLVYTGTLTLRGPRERDPRPLFAAMRRLAAERPAVASRLRVVLAGRLDTGEEQLLRTLDLGGAVEHVGSLSREAAGALQRDADALLLLTGPHASEATGKLFDYLAAGRPILALAHENVAASIVRGTGTGVAVAPDDVGAIAQTLETVVDGTLAAAYRPRNLERYIYPGPAEEAAALIERAIARRARQSETRGAVIGDTST
jgi:glycosyltransferase involved in cell wall biosynthesis